MSAPTIVPTVVGVHGFNFDPKSEGNDPWKLYHDWADMLGEPVHGFAWYSSVPTPAGIMRALASGFLDRYRYAYQSLAVTASHALAHEISGIKGPVSIVCHSLGSRVTLAALSMIEPGKIERILILDGAELQKAAIAALAIPNPPEILNVCVRHDRVLKDLGSWASLEIGSCIGYAGIGDRPPPRWRDLFLDDPDTQRRALEAYEWGFDAVNELDPLGHWESYEIIGNWPLYRHFMKGLPLDKLWPAPAAAAT